MHLPRLVVFELAVATLGNGEQLSAGLETGFGLVKRLYCWLCRHPYLAQLVGG